MRYVEQKSISSYAHLYQVFKKHGSLHEQAAYVPPATGQFGPTIMRAVEVVGTTATGDSLQKRSTMAARPCRAYSALELDFFGKMYELCSRAGLTQTAGFSSSLELLAERPFDYKLQRDVVAKILSILFKYRRSDKGITNTICFVPQDIFALLKTRMDCYGVVLDDKHIAFITIIQSYEHLRILFSAEAIDVGDTSKYCSKEKLPVGGYFYRVNNTYDIFEHYDPKGKHEFDRTYLEIFPMPDTNNWRHGEETGNKVSSYLYLFDPKQFTIFTQPVVDFDKDILWTVITANPGIFLQ